MRFRLPLAALAIAFCAFSQTISVDMVQQFVRSAISQKNPDKQVADMLHRYKLTQKLDDSVIEQLQSEGAGPKTVAALKDLGTASAALPPPAAPAPKKVFVEPPPPPYEDQQRIINEVREYALNYSKNLPNYICSRITRRFFDPTGKDNWRTADTISAKLTYFEQQEKYQNVIVNGQMTEKSIDQLGGTSSQGEFGSLLRDIFEPATDAEFHWNRLRTLRGHVCHVFKYSVDQAHSRWSIYDGEAKQSVVPAYQGEIFVDRNTMQVLRVSLESVNIPPDFRVRVAKDTLDYDYADLSGQKFLLPLRALVELDDNRHYQTKNDNQFLYYKKFSADTVLTFDTDTPPPLDDSKTKEQPVTQDTKPDDKKPPKKQ
jgi:hypothetical protein